MSGYGVIDPAESDPLSGARVPRVLIDGRKLQHGGIGTYLENLILGLLEKRSADVSLLADKDVARKLPWIQQVRLFHEPARPYSFDELFLMPRRIPWPEFDLFHVPHFTLPYGIPLPSVITLHDLIHINYPERWY